MSNIERVTVALTTEMAAVVKNAVANGVYASSSELIREALRDWQHKQALQAQALQALRAEVQQGIDDKTQGRVNDFDAKRIISQGEKRLAKSAPSA